MALCLLCHQSCQDGDRLVARPFAREPPSIEGEAPVHHDVITTQILEGDLSRRKRYAVVAIEVLLMIGHDQGAGVVRDPSLPDLIVDLEVPFNNVDTSIMNNPPSPVILRQIDVIL